MVMRRYFDEQIAHLNEQMIAMGGMVETLHDGAQVKKVDYTPEGIEIEAVVDGILYGRLREYIIGEC